MSKVSGISIEINKKLAERYAKSITLLRELEWSARTINNEKACPICHETKRQGHEYTYRYTDDTFSVNERVELCELKQVLEGEVNDECNC